MSLVKCEYDLARDGYTLTVVLDAEDLEEIRLTRLEQQTLMQPAECGADLILAVEMIYRRIELIKRVDEEGKK